MAQATKAEVGRIIYAPQPGTHFWKSSNWMTMTLQELEDHGAKFSRELPPPDERGWDAWDWFYGRDAEGKRERGKEYWHWHDSGKWLHRETIDPSSLSWDPESLYALPKLPLQPVQPEVLEPWTDEIVRTWHEITEQQRQEVCKALGLIPVIDNPIRITDNVWTIREGVNVVPFKLFGKWYREVVPSERATMKKPDRYLVMFPGEEGWMHSVDGAREWHPDRRYAVSCPPPPWSASRIHKDITQEMWDSGIEVPQPKGALTPDPVGQFPPRSVGFGWVCAHCKATNPDLAIVCGGCLAGKGQQPSPPPEYSATHGLVRSVVVGPDWPLITLPVNIKDGTWIEWRLKGEAWPTNEALDDVDACHRCGEPIIGMAPCPCGSHSAQRDVEMTVESVNFFTNITEFRGGNKFLRTGDKVIVRKAK